MDRLNKVHRASRVQLPKSVINFDQAEAAPREHRRFSPATFHFLAVLGFVTCGGAVVAAASYIALSIN